MDYNNLFVTSTTLLILLNILTSINAAEVVAVYPEGKTFVTATHRIKFEVECKVNGREKNQTISWVKDNKHLTADDRIHINDNKVEIKLTTEADAGNYVCELRDSKQPLNTAPIASATVVVLYLPKLYVSTEHKDQTFIEETDINITCSSWGKPTTMIWKIGNETYESSRGRVTLHEYNSIPNANLKISNANKTIDRGNYTCYGKSPAGDTNSVSINVRIKGKYAALWPFFGICAEVLLLCAVILIYEKRRDKTELEESDTDQGPETKSSPDHGQDNVRQRK